MKSLSRRLMPAVFLLLMTGCATTESRISRHQAAFDAWPAEVREKVRAGRIEVGFTPEMVQVALGEADRRSTRTTAAGTDEVWAYFDRRPKFMAAIGAFLGWEAVVFTLVVASMVGAAYGGVMVALRKQEWSGRLYFGPFLALAATLWIFVGPRLVAWYLHFSQHVLDRLLGF